MNSKNSARYNFDLMIRWIQKPCQILSLGMTITFRYWTMNKTISLLSGLLMTALSIMAGTETDTEKRTGELVVMTYNIHHCNPPSAGDKIDIPAIAAVITNMMSLYRKGSTPREFAAISLLAIARKARPVLE